MNDLKALFKSFFYALRGIVSTIVSERNMRVHLTCLVYMFSILSLTDWFVLSRTDWALLVAMSALVIGGELFNTAIENCVDLSSRGYNEFAKKAKDAASGAVLIFAIAAVAVGLFVLLQPNAFKLMFTYFASKPLMLALFVFSLVPATLFIFWGLPRKGGKKNG